MSIAAFAPDPPFEFPPARTVQVQGRGEFFLRDSGALGDQDDRPAVMLLHGWMATADLNWAGTYRSLTDAGYRVLAIDHRGHGRGLRALVPFRLADCAGDAAAVLRALELAPALIVGYSMGGAIAQLLARDHPDVVAGLVVSATAQHWQEPQIRRSFLALGPASLVMRFAPNAFWDWGFKRAGFNEISTTTAWLRSELLRHSTEAVIEAGRELGRFDSRPWLRPQPFPTAMVLTTKDTVVGRRKQWELAAALETPIFEAPIDHMDVAYAKETYDPHLIEALDSLRTASAGVSR